MRFHTFFLEISIIVSLFHQSPTRNKLLSPKILSVGTQKKMDHVRTIQEIVDEHKEKMPTGVVTDVLD